MMTKQMVKRLETVHVALRCFPMWGKNRSRYRSRSTKYPFLPMLEEL